MNNNSIDNNEIENNEEQELKVLKSKYLKAQLEYVEALKKSPKYKRVFEKMKSSSKEPSILWYNAFDKIEELDDDRKSIKNMDELEKEITVNIALIQNWASRRLEQKEISDSKDIER